MRRILTLLMTTALLPPLAVADTVLTPAERSGLTLTVTQSGQALVRDKRAAGLDKGGQVLVFEGVARQAVDGSAWLSASGVAVREQAFSTAGIDSLRLMAGAVGSDVTVIWRDGAGQREERATLMSAEPVPLFRIGGKIVAGTPERIVYDSLPEGLRLGPSYAATITAEQAGRRDVELAYLSGGLDWRADYTAELSSASDRLTLTAWATISNGSGTDFSNARLNLVAGELSRQPGPGPAPMKAARALMAAAEASPERLELGPHHLYTIAQPVTLSDGERRQVALLAPASLPVERRLVLDPAAPHAWRGRWREQGPVHPEARLHVRNNTGNPLPAGLVRVLHKTRDGNLALAGEDRIGPVPAGGSATLSLGRASDVTAHRVQTDFQKVSADISEAAFEIRLANGGDQPAKVVVRESFAGEWLVLAESAQHAKDDAFTASWIVEVPAKGERVLTVRVRVKG